MVPPAGGAVSSRSFLHAADLHLDSPLLGLERYPGAPADELRSATRRAFDAMVELAIREAVGFVLLAGDIYDGDWRDYHTGLYFASRLGRLHEAGIPVVLVRGNHDAQSRITKSLRLPPGVHELPFDAPSTVLFEPLGVAIHGQSYPNAEVSEDLTARYPAPRPGLFNIGLLHTSVDGRPGHAPYAPTNVDALRKRGYDYWALGHVHQREVLREEPWIVFSGNLQGRHARELGPKGATLVRLEGTRVVSVEPKELDVLRWARIDLSIEGLVTLESLLDRAEAAVLAELPDDARRSLACRLRLFGRGALHEALERDPERATQELRALGASLGGGRVWVEKIVLDTKADVDLDAQRARPDPLGELLRWLKTLPDDPATLGELGEQLVEVRRKLPRAVLDEDGSEQTAEDLVRRLLPEVEQLLLPLLLSADEERR
jgi:DNA repair exonuclease SbcCD nuclease subunit